MKKQFATLSSLLAGAAFAAALFAYGRLPARIPLHWNAAGEIDGWGPPGAIFAFPALMAGLALLWAVLPGVSPKRYDVERFGPTWWRSGLLVIALPGYVEAVLLWHMLAGPIAVDRALVGGIAMLSLLLGNVLGKVRRNFWLGVRTPWTLADDRVWYATHRLAGKTMVASGLLALACLLLGLPAQLAIGLIVAGALVPAGYSLVYYKRLERA